jgi:hypothetical protein
MVTVRLEWRTLYNMIYLSTAIRLTPGGSSTVHIYTQTPGGSSTVHIYTQTIHRTTKITNNLEECGPCSIFASFTLAFALQLRKNHGKISVRLAEECQYTYYQNTHTLQNLHTPTHITKQYKTTTVQIQTNTVQDIPK